MNMHITGSRDLNLMNKVVRISQYVFFFFGRGGGGVVVDDMMIQPQSAQIGYSI